MFIRKNSWQYWLGAALVVYFGIKGFKKKPSIEKVESNIAIAEKGEKQLNSIEIDGNNLKSSLEKAIKAMKIVKEYGSLEKSDAKIEKLEKEYPVIASTFPDLNNSSKISISYLTPFPKNIQAIGLCQNSYIFHIKGINEEGEVVFSKASVSVDSLKGNDKIYNLFRRALLLTFKGSKIEIFTFYGEEIEKLITGTSTIKPGAGILLKIEVETIKGDNNFDASSIKTFINLTLENSRKRADFEFFCDENIVIEYSLFTLQGNFIRKERKKLILGESQTPMECTLEYLALNSRSGKIDAIILSDDSKDRIIIKGEIKKKNGASQ